MRTKKRADTRTRRWTKEEYYRLGELGFFHGQRVELIEGRLMVQCPQKSLHGGIVDLLTEILSLRLPPSHRLRVQLPLDIGQTSEPEPDFAIVQGTRRQYLAAHPTSALLVIEVADSSLSYDREQKGSLYARAGLLDYWIVNLVDDRVEVYRDPVPDAAHLYGYRYASRVDLVPPASIAPLALPGMVVAVADMLP
jgi:Uma2 family endonuclease